MNEITLSVAGLHAYYQTRYKENIYAVDGVDLTLTKGEVLGIAGESGCGKSTLAQCLMGCFFKPLCYSGGTLHIGGQDATAMESEAFRTQILGKKIAYIPQSAMNALNPTMKIGRFIVDVLKEHRPELTKEQRLQLANERFIALGLEPKILNAYPNELSGGMKQRTVIAVSTILNPKVLIADEPTSALDVTSQKKVILLMRKLLHEGYVDSIVFITHELPLLFHVADTIAVMYAGQIVEVGASREIVFDPIHPYSKALMGSIIVPELDIKEQKHFAIPGAPPNLKQKLTGCRFFERCSERMPECRIDQIAMNWQGGRSYRCILKRGGEDNAVV